MNVYERCPEIATPRFVLRLIRPEDVYGLLAVYSDPAAQKCFNADNCTSDFCYTTLQQMEECMNMWLWSYAHGYFVRWTILEEDVPVGTVEMFRRDDEDGGTGVLRLDLHSRLETSYALSELLTALLPQLHRLFGCACVLTKSTPEMEPRCQVLQQLGFVPRKEPLIGHSGAQLPHYWVHMAI